MVGFHSGNIMQCCLVYDNYLEEYHDSQVNNADYCPKYSHTLKAKFRGLIFSINLE